MKPIVSIVIPVYNEANTICQVLEQVWTQPLPKVNKQIIIVESRSTDASRELVTKFYEEHKDLDPTRNVHLILQDQPQGKGRAVREGLEACQGEIILIQDGDLEYDISDYPQLIDPILEQKTNFVLGSRHLSAGSWKIRKFGKNQIRSSIMNLGGIIFHGLFNLVFGTHLTDPTTMFKVFRRSCLEQFDLNCNRFDFDYELLGKLIRSGNPPLEIPVSYMSRGFEDGKKIRVFKDPMTWVWAIFKVRFTPLKSKGFKKGMAPKQ